MACGTPAPPTLTGSTLDCRRGSESQLGSPGGTTSTPRQVATPYTPVSPGWTAAAVGSYHTCALLARDSSLWCWGSGGVGELGDGSSVSSEAPRQVSASGAFLQVRLGSVHACALKSTGMLVCWGLGTSGQIGNNVSLSVNVPTAVTDPDAQSPFIQVSAAGTYSCGVKQTGLVYCWCAAAVAGAAAVAAASASAAAAAAAAT